MTRNKQVGCYQIAESYGLGFGGQIDFDIMLIKIVLHDWKEVFFPSVDSVVNFHIVVCIIYVNYLPL